MRVTDLPVHRVGSAPRPALPAWGTSPSPAWNLAVPSKDLEQAGLLQPENNTFLVCSSQVGEKPSKGPSLPKEKSRRATAAPAGQGGPHPAEDLPRSAVRVRRRIKPSPTGQRVQLSSAAAPRSSSTRQVQHWVSQLTNADQEQPITALV